MEVEIHKYILSYILILSYIMIRSYILILFVILILSWFNPIYCILIKSCILIQSYPIQCFYPIICMILSYILILSHPLYWLVRFMKSKFYEFQNARLTFNVRSKPDIFRIFNNTFFILDIDTIRGWLDSDSWTLERII